MFGQLFESIVMVIAKTYFALTAFTTLVAALFFSTIWWLIESPHYLANVSNLEGAKKNLKIIRPDYTDNEVNREFEVMVESIARERRNKVRVNWLNFYKLKAFREPLQCALLLNVVAVTCGGPVMTLYVAVMLPQNLYFANEYYALISFSIQFIAAIGSTFVMDRFGRRRLFLAAALISLAMQSLNAFAYALYDSGGGDFWKWVFILNNFLYMFVDRGLISPCNCTVRSEIFPYTLKGIGNALCVICQAISLIVNYQIYDFINPKYGLSINFAIFAFDSALLAAVIYFLLPEMGGRSLAEVQNKIGDEFQEYEALISKNVKL